MGALFGVASAANTLSDCQRRVFLELFLLKIVAEMPVVQIELRLLARYCEKEHI